MPADAGGTGELVERDVTGELVAQELACSPKRGIAARGPAAFTPLGEIGRGAQPLHEQRLALESPRRRLQRAVELDESPRQQGVAPMWLGEADVQPRPLDPVERLLHARRLDDEQPRLPARAGMRKPECAPDGSHAQTSPSSKTNRSRPRRASIAPATTTPTTYSPNGSTA
jgi:hypothetical protein